MRCDAMRCDAMNDLARGDRLDFQRDFALAMRDSRVYWKEYEMMLGNKQPGSFCWLNIYLPPRRRGSWSRILILATEILDNWVSGLRGNIEPLVPSLTVRSRFVM